jgi:hypothetical protein
MKPSVFASVALSTLGAVAWREPSRCPYCPDATRAHWIRWGFYPRWAEGKRERVQIQRYRCKITGRTFSLLPDSLLPYRYFKTSRILGWLHAIFVKSVAVAVLARRESVARGTLRHLARSFLRVVPILRTPGRETAAAPGELLKLFAAMTDAALIALFAGWKEIEPKHSVTGIHRR